MPNLARRILVKVASNPPREYEFRGSGMETAAESKVRECRRGDLYVVTVLRQEFRGGSWQTIIPKVTIL